MEFYFFRRMYVLVFLSAKIKKEEKSDGIPLLQNKTTRFFYFKQCFIGTTTTTHLGRRVYEAYALLVDGDEEELGEVWVGGLLDLEEGGSEGGPAVDDLQEGDLGVLRGEARVLHNLMWSTKGFLEKCGKGYVLTTKRKTFCTKIWT